MHHCVVVVGVKLLAYCFNGFHAGFLQCFPELLIYLLHTLCKGCSLCILRHGCQASLKVINDGKDSLYDVLGSHLIHGGLFLVCPLAEILKFRHLTFHPVGEIFYLFIPGVFLLLKKSLFFFLFSGRRLLCIFLCAFRHIFCRLSGLSGSLCIPCLPGSGLRSLFCSRFLLCIQGLVFLF